ncbi:MAG: hypothetical protein AAGB26_06050 [Planctomycetota bacterium]
MYTPYSQRSVLDDGTTVDWRQDVNWRHSENHHWSVSIVGFVERPDDGRIVVAATQYLDVYEVEALVCQPIPWNTPGGRDTRGKWWRGREVDEPFKSRFEIKLEGIEQPVQVIERMVLGGEWRVAKAVGSFDIPVSEAGRWQDAVTGLRVRSKIHRDVHEIEQQGEGESSFHVTYDASIDYEDSYTDAGSMFITAHAVYEDGSTGSAYMRGGTRSGGTTTAEYAFRGGENGQRLAALRVFYATGWESHPFQFTVTELSTPFDSPAR